MEFQAGKSRQCNFRKFQARQFQARQIQTNQLQARQFQDIPGKAIQWKATPDNNLLYPHYVKLAIIYAFTVSILSITIFIFTGQESIISN